MAVVLGSAGNGNTTALSLATSLAGSGDPSLPFFDNVGTSSTGDASVTYLGDGWAISAAHVTISSAVGQVHFGATGYTVDNSTIHQLHNANNSLADLQVFRLTTSPALPSITASLIATATPAGNARQIMIGNGADAVAQHFWSVNKSSVPWVWSTVTPPGPAVPGTTDYSGIDVTGGHNIRWGENKVTNTSQIRNNTNCYTTNFDNLAYTGITPLGSEAMATDGDSGGAVFSISGGQWQLAGIMISVSPSLSGQPSQAAMFGNNPTNQFSYTAIADLRQYRTEILATIPEPSSFALAALAAAALAFCGRHRRPWHCRPAAP